MRILSMLAGLLLILLQPMDARDAEDVPFRATYQGTFTIAAALLTFNGEGTGTPIVRRVGSAGGVFRDVATFAVRAVILRHDRAIADWAAGPSAQQSERRRDEDHAGEGRVDEWHMNI